jgi:hypothetical protein
VIPIWIGTEPISKGMLPILIGSGPLPGGLAEAEGGIGAGRVQISRDLPDEGGGDLLLPDGLLKEDQGGNGRGPALRLFFTPLL